MKILVIEDDLLTSQAISAMLSQHRYAVEVANDGQAGWDLIESFDYDLILLDITLPRLDGIALCQRIREKGLHIPVMLLTGHNSSHEKATGLDAGADDYMVKPIEEEELVARVRALLRRSELSTQPILTWGELYLDPSCCQATYDSELLTLTPKEYTLLELFLRNSKRVFSCGMILEHLWAFEEMPGEEAIRTHIKGLRQKLKKAGAPHDLIETVYGIGYRLKPIEQQSAGGQQNNHKSNSKQIETQKVLDQLDDIWYQSKDRVNQRIEILKQAKASLSNQPLNRELCKRAQQEAHALVGTLGTFGFFKGTDLARNIEQKLQLDDVEILEHIDDLDALIIALCQEIEQPPHHLTSVSSPNDSEKQTDQVRSKIIVVDDDPTLLAVLSSLLHPWGIQVITLNDPQQCLETLSNHSPDLLVLDIEMPKLNGIELCQKIRSKPYWDDLPIIFLTAHNNADIVNQVFNLGAIDYIHKPIIGPEFIVRIVNYLERIRLVKQMVAKCHIYLASEKECDPEFRTLIPSTSEQNSSFSLIDRKLTLQLKQESAVVQLALSALRGTAFSDLMKEAAKYIVYNMDLEFCSIFELLPFGNAFLLKAGEGWSEGIVELTLISQHDSLVGRALQSNEPILIEQYLTDGKFNDTYFFQEHGIKSGCMVPINCSSQSFGVLGAYSIKERFLSSEDMKFLQVTANILSSAFEQQNIKVSLEQIQANLELRILERTAELVEVNKQLQLELKKQSAKKIENHYSTHADG
jgi:DNA-binding response OmpR family regulator/HPt (histidine-containing phosphotransfer) domain-containing protein